MNKKLAFAILIGFAILVALVSVVMFIMAIWIPDERWVQTGMVLLIMAIFTAICAPLVK